MLDGLSQITGAPAGTSAQFTRPNTAPATSIPADVKAAQIAEASESSMLAAMFGRPERGTGMERERADDLNPMHVQFLANSSAVEDSMWNSPRLQRLMKDKKNDTEVVDELLPAGAGAVSQGSGEEENARIPDRREEGPRSGDPRYPVDAAEQQRVLVESLRTYPRTVPLVLRHRFPRRVLE